MILKKMILKKMPLVFLLVFFLAYFGVENASAQESTNEAINGSNLEQEQIYNKSRNTQKIVDLRNLYRDQIEAYRFSDKEFNVAKTHYFNLLTLTSLEELVSLTRSAMSDRLKVLITYMELLSATLDETPGVELALKEESLNQIRSTIISLKLHQEDIALAKDRSSLNTQADDFEAFVDPYDQVSYRALSLIRIGQIQAVYDAAVIIESDIKTSQKGVESGAVIESKRTRAYQEILRNFTITSSGLKLLVNKVIESEDDHFSRSFYERTLNDLEPIYIQLSKSLDHLEELLKL